MTGWAVRGVGMALVHVVARTVLALTVATWPSQGSALRVITLVTVVVFAVVWGGLDGISAHRRGDSSTDFTMLWLKSAAVAAVLAGLLSWLLSAVTSVSVSNNSLFFEVTSGAAFTVLIVFVPAVIAVAVGRWLGRRDDKTPENLRPGKKTDRAPATSGAPDRGDADADTEIFAPVRRNDISSADTASARPDLTKRD